MEETTNCTNRKAYILQMIDYKIKEMGDMVFLTRSETITTNGSPMILSKSIIFEIDELPQIMEILNNYANQKNQGLNQ